jgi:hypothetical protein
VLPTAASPLDDAAEVNAPVRRTASARATVADHRLSADSRDGAHAIGAHGVISVTAIAVKPEVWSSGQMTIATSSFFHPRGAVIVRRAYAIGGPRCANQRQPRSRRQ